MVLYFSGTGNSRYVAGRVARALGEPLCSLNERIKAGDYSPVETGERLIVVTSAVPVHCRTALTHLGLMPYFEQIIFAHDLQLEKKDPQLWRLTAKLMGVAPEDCTLYDDSVEACRGAKAAGMHADAQWYLMPSSRMVFMSAQVAVWVNNV